MIILGIDPGLAHTGWGIIETRGSVYRTRAYGCVETKAAEPLDQRLGRIFDGVSEAIELYHPTQLAIEKIFFGEKVNRHKAIALIMGAIGVVAVVFYFKQVPSLALSIAFSFAIYAAIKKGLGMPPIISLLYETIFLAPIALGIVIYIETHGIGALAVATGGKYFLLMFCGLFTAFPLVLFANGANKTSMFILGLTEYISPTISLFLSIFYFKEEFYPVQLIAFAVIWTGLVFFTIGEYREYRNAGNN